VEVDAIEIDQYGDVIGVCVDCVPERWVGIEEVIEHTGLSRATIYRLLRDPDALPSKKIRGRRVFRLSEVDSHLERRADRLRNLARIQSELAVFFREFREKFDQIPPHSGGFIHVSCTYTFKEVIPYGFPDGVPECVDAGADCEEVAGSPRTEQSQLPPEPAVGF